MLKRIIKKVSKIIAWFLACLIVLAISIIVYTQIDPVFGGSPNRASMKKIEASKNFDGEIFINSEKTAMMHYQEDTLAWFQENDGFLGQLFPGKDKNPQKKLLSTKFDKHSFNSGSFAWLGHSTLLMNVDNKHIIIDPVFYKASPIFLGGKPFVFQNTTTISDLPKIDYVLITHDHYDHLDAEAIQEMKSLVTTFLVPLGIKAHLLKWGVEDEKIIEFDWYEKFNERSISFIFTPSRHFSGRGILGRNTTLWGGWIIKGNTQNIYASGDSGYTKEFAVIGEKYGPFDIAFLESGAYNSEWSQIHMFPEQSVQAGIDLNAKILFPIHWGKFDLSYHNWKEPIQRFTQYSIQKQQKIITPLVGETFNLTETYQTKWWDDNR